MTNQITCDFCFFVFFCFGGKSAVLFSVRVFVQQVHQWGRFRTLDDLALKSGASVAWPLDRTSLTLLCG